MKTFEERRQQLLARVDRYRTEALREGELEPGTTVDALEHIVKLAAVNRRFEFQLDGWVHAQRSLYELAAGRDPFVEDYDTSGEDDILAEQRLEEAL